MKCPQCKINDMEVLKVEDSNYIFKCPKCFKTQILSKEDIEKGGEEDGKETK